MSSKPTMAPSSKFSRLLTGFVALCLASLRFLVRLLSLAFGLVRKGVSQVVNLIGHLGLLVCRKVLLPLCRLIFHVVFQLVLPVLFRRVLRPLIAMLWSLLRSLIVVAFSVLTLCVKAIASIVMRIGKNLKWLIQRLSEGPSGMAEIAKAFEPWLRAFGVLWLVLVAGLTIFLPAVQRSIASTPHPELVYTIFAVALISAGLAGYTLEHFLKEEQLAKDLISMNEDLRRKTVAKLVDSDFKSALTLCMSPMGHQPGEHRDLVESEMLACEAQADARLNLSSYLGNSLIGIGLVGTFVGLLSALADLAGVFSALMGSNALALGNDPMSMFSGMLVKLQEPMKGMATAFVASLYGLMGSLLMGLVVYAVRKAGQQSAAHMRAFMRDQDRLTTLTMHEHPSHDINPSSLANSIQVLNKHQEVLELLLAELIQGVKRDKSSDKPKVAQ